MIRYLGAYGATAVAFVVLDALWLTFVGPRLYKPLLNDILASRVQLAPAVVFYVLYVAGVVALAVRPAGTLREAAILGAILGLVSYGTYALTDQAILKIWATRITVLDMGWGAIASAAGAAAGYVALRKLSA